MSYKLLDKKRLIEDMKGIRLGGGGGDGLWHIALPFKKYTENILEHKEWPFYLLNNFL